MVSNFSAPGAARSATAREGPARIWPTAQAETCKARELVAVPVLFLLYWGWVGELEAAGFCIFFFNVFPLLLKALSYSLSF